MSPFPYDEPFGSKLERKNLQRIERILASINITIRLIARGHLQAAVHMLGNAVALTRRNG